MTRHERSLSSKVRERAMTLGMRLMNDPKNQTRVLKAIDAFQRGKTRLATLTEQVLHFYNLPSQRDFKALGKKLSALRKEANELRRRVEEHDDLD